MCYSDYCGKSSRIYRRPSFKDAYRNLGSWQHAKRCWWFFFPRWFLSYCHSIADYLNQIYRKPSISSRWWRPLSILHLLLPKNFFPIVLSLFLRVRFLISFLRHTFCVLTQSLLLSGKFLTVAQVGNPENVNSAVEQFTYVGDITDDSLRTKLAVFGTMVQEPLFDQLRAREQLGYIVSTIHPFSSGSLFLTRYICTGLEWPSQVDWFHWTSSCRSK